MASDLPPYQHVIQDERTGMLAGTTQQWVEKVDKLIGDADLRKEIGMAALKNAWRSHSFTSGKLALLKNIFPG